MDKKMKSEGRCPYCDQMFLQKKIGKHLAGHLAEMEKADKDNPAQTYVHIEVGAWEMFLHLLVRGDAKLEIIDNFLKDIWLECCGHMSCFRNSNFEISKSKKAGDVFVSCAKIVHDYDFGDTTRVLLHGLNSYQLNLKEKIILLSRNEPLKIMCSICGKKPAVNLCTACNQEDLSFFCKPCSKKHEKECEDFADYACMPVVNSPRMGVCGYEGGVIDTARDVVYQGE